MRIGCTLLAAFGIDFVAAVNLHAQEPDLVSGEVICAECVITLDTVVTIGGFDGPGHGVVSVFSGVAVDRRGRILVWAVGEAEVAVFDSTGTYIQTIGGRGEGPGEYQSISHVDVGRRYIHVFENHKGRTMLDHDFEVIRTDRFPGNIVSVDIVSDDVAAFVAEIPTRASIGHTFHILRPSGEISSYGYDGLVYSLALTPRTPMLAMAGNDHTVWAVPEEVNRIVRWDLVPEPQVGRVFDRSVAEFDEGGDAFMPATLGSAMLDDRGLWIIWHTADPDWTGPPPSPESLSPYSFDVDQLRDAWLDLVDPDTGLTIARYRQDAAVKGFAAGSRYVVDYQETDAGVPFLHLLEPRLVRR